MPMTHPETPFQDHVSYALAAAHRRVVQDLAPRLKTHGVQIEAWRVMELLGGEARLTMGELAKSALINPPTLSKLVDRMVSEGLVHRQIAAEDHRQVNLLLTDLGRMRMMQIRTDVTAQDEAFCSNLDASEGKQLLELLSRLAT